MRNRESILAQISPQLSNTHILLQPKAACTCGGACPGCKEDSGAQRLSQPRVSSANGGFETAGTVGSSTSQVTTIQRHRSIPGPDDPLEHEADRAADTALRHLASHGPMPVSSVKQTSPRGSMLLSSCSDCGPSGDDAEPIVQATGPRTLQRAFDPDESEAEAAAKAAVDEPAVEDDNSADSDADTEEEDGEEELEEDDSDTPIQAKSSQDVITPHHDASGNIYQQIEQARSGGSSLDAPTRVRMESAFGADFGDVRVHTNSRAAELASSVRSLAFTSGRDIFFGAGHYDPGSAPGERLLAHELAHVLQQGAAPIARRIAVSSVASDVVQLQQDGGEGRLIGELYFFDAKDNNTYKSALTETNPLGMSPGYYEVKLTAKGEGRYKFSVVNGETYELVPGDTKDFAARLKLAKRSFFVVYAAPASEDEEKEPEEEKEKPSPDDPTGAAGPTDEKETPETGTRKTPEVGTGKPPGKQPAIEKSRPGGETGEKKPGDDKQPGGGKEGGEKKEDTIGETTEDSDKKAARSKYGWLGLLNMPQEVADVLEKIIDTFLDSEEVMGLRDTLKALTELAEHADELGELFKDSNSLLEVVLGLKENKALDAIERWVAKDVKQPKPAKKTHHKGIVAFALKIVALVRKIRRVLKPVFKIRSGLQSVFAGIGLLLETMPAVEELLELTKDPSKVSEIQFKAYADKFAADFAVQLKGKLDKAPQQLKAGFTRIVESDLISYQDVARAVTAAILMAVPKQYKPIVSIARRLGLDRAIADNVVAPMVPEASLDAINNSLRMVMKLMETSLDAAVDDLAKLIDGMVPGFLEELPNQLIATLKTSRKNGGAPTRGSIGAIAGLIASSPGEPIDDDTRTEAETRLGHTFGNVRIHRDIAAGATSEQLNVNAFTIGDDIFFGPGKFDPESNNGRRLLYHELTHTRQQGKEGKAAFQPDSDWKDLLNRLSKRYSAAIIAELKGARMSSPAKEKEAAAIRDKVAKLVKDGGRKVVSRTNPMLPTGYMYIPKNKGKIKGIRRSIKWIQAVPRLAIRNGRIKLAALIIDPKKAARAALRAALGCNANQEAHHVIPLFLILHPVVQTARDKGFQFNGRDNGECILKKYHSGSHDKYTADVTDKLQALQRDHGTDWAKLKGPFEKELEGLHTYCRTKRSKFR